MNLYTLAHIIKIAEKRTILNIDHLEIDRGRIYALLGPNGAGKTTLLEILAFLKQPASGDLTFMGEKVLFQEKALQRLRRQVVMLDQFPILFSTTVYKNIEYGLALRKVAGKERRIKIEQVLDMLGMRSYKHVQAKTLSGGETQRVALARALVLEPKVFLCDEPTASVDLESQSTITALLKRINREEGISVIFTTHDRQLAANLAHQIIILNQGRQVHTSYENILSCEMMKSGKNIRCLLNGTFTLELPAAVAASKEGNRQLWINPEKIRINRGNRPHGEYHFTGRLTTISLDGQRIRLIVDIGFPLTVLLSADEYRTAMPSVGESLNIFFNSDSISIN